MMLWLSVSVILRNKAAFDNQKGEKLGLKCARMRLVTGLCPDPLGELQRSPDPLAAIGGGVPTSKGEGREGMGKGKEGMGRGKGRMGRGGRKGEGREGSPCMRSHE